MKKNNRYTLKKYLRKKSKDEEFCFHFRSAGMHLKLARMVEKLRLKSKLTQAELARRAKVSQPMIARLERGDQSRIPTLATITKILRALNYKLDLVIKKAS